MLLRLTIILIFISMPAMATELNDGHIHYNQDIRAQLPARHALRLLDENHINRAIVSSTPTSGTEKLYQLNPQQIIPFLRPYRNYRDRFTWHSDPSIIEYIKQHLTTGIYKGFGEFHLFREHKNTDTVQRVTQLAAQHGLILSAHADGETIESLFAISPGISIIWAHCGMDHPVTDVHRMLKQYSNLYCELSFREGLTDESGKLSLEWKNLLETFARRFLTGSDTYIPRRWANLPEITDQTLDWLSQLTPQNAKLISSDNFNRLFPVSNDK